MHPASSLIYFTVASGFGFGFLFFLGLGMPALTGANAFWSYFIGYFLAVSGLMSSVLHLGNKVNAVKAMSQWRSSWLSREGVFAILTLVTFAPVAITQIWDGPNFSLVGYLGSFLAIITIYCTAMIYGQLKTVPRWNQHITPFLFLAFGITGGAIIAQQDQIAAIGLPVLLILQIGHWVIGDRSWSSGLDTAESATGLGGSTGTVRLLERPHTGKNYLTTEMVHLVGRKHSDRLRGLVVLGLLLCVLGSIFIAPISLLVWLLPLVFAALISRWLFFAEAEHVVGLYYGRAK
ncbi:MAG: dimethyl sulfoxide reductase anchor subunit family protein [Alphaproteobacteria bacterium]